MTKREAQQRYARARAEAAQREQQHDYAREGRAFLSKLREDHGVIAEEAERKLLIRQQVDLQNFF